MKRTIALLAAALLATTPASAATRYARPTTLAAVLAAAKAGDRIVLARGSYGDVKLPVRDHAPAVEIEASQARMRSLTAIGTAGWTWRGGTFAGEPSPKQWTTVDIRGSHRIEVASATMTGTQDGARIGLGSSDIVMRGNTVRGMTSDGFQIAGAERVSIIGNSCVDVRPIAPVFDAAGKMVKDGTHPDCVQFWSDGKFPTRDLLIAGNKVRGDFQGIGKFGAGTVERVTVTGNDILVSSWWGISLTNVTGAVVRNNTVRTIPGARSGGPRPQAVKTRLRTQSGAARCGNTLDGVREEGCPPARGDE